MSASGQQILNPLGIVDAQTNRHQIDPENPRLISQYIDERLEFDTGNVRVSEVYDDYVKWCAASREEATPINFFPGALEERGIRHKRVVKGSVFVGRRLKNTDKGDGLEAPWDKPLKPDLRDMINALPRTNGGGYASSRMEEKKKIKSDVEVFDSFDD